MKKKDIERESNWKRLAINVTYYRLQLYFSITDCGPGSNCMKEIRVGTTIEIVGVLN